VAARLGDRRTELAEPGLVYAPDWHPDDPDDPFRDAPGRSLSLVGVARKP